MQEPLSRSVHVYNELHVYFYIDSLLGFKTPIYFCPLSELILISLFVLRAIENLIPFSPMIYCILLKNQLIMHKILINKIVLDWVTSVYRTITFVERAANVPSPTVFPLRMLECCLWSAVSINYALSINYSIWIEWNDTYFGDVYTWDNAVLRHLILCLEWLLYRPERSLTWCAIFMIGFY